MLGVAVTTAVWLLVTYMTPPTDRVTLQNFYDRIRPFNMGWRAAVRVVPSAGGSLSAALLCWFLGCIVVYAALFGTGYLLYGQPLFGGFGVAVAVVAAIGLFGTLPRVGFE